MSEVSALKVTSDVLDRLAKGTFRFRPDYPVSKNSRFGDSKWSFLDSSNRRLDCYWAAGLTIDWNALTTELGIPITIVNDIKRYAFIRCHFTREVLGPGRGRWNAHPATIVAEISTLTRFLSVVCREASVGQQPLIRYLSDIVVEDLEAALSNSKIQHAHLQKILKNLAIPGMVRQLEHGPVGWNYHDIRNLPWKIKERVPYRRLPEELFQFLSNAATKDVKDFLAALSIETEDKTKKSGPNIFLSKIPTFHLLFEEYVEMRTNQRNATVKEWISYSKWCRMHGYMIQEFSDLIHRGRLAAEMIIAMYTGARLSELNSFTTDSLIRDGDIYVLKGTEIKRRSQFVPIFRDKWVAIPILRDAVKLLTQTARLVGSEHLFHHRWSTSGVRRMGSGQHKKRLNHYLKTIDQNGQWKGTQLHSLRFRHSLVYELRKAGLGIPYITFQLKHYHDSLNRSLSNVTIMYGNIAGRAAEMAVQEANRKFTEQIYHPDAAITGGGAEQHKNRVAAYFKGMVLRGVNVEDAITALAKHGLPFTDVGTALCTGQRTIVLDGFKQDPPCIGQLRCNPFRCTNAIIPDFKKDAWLRLEDENSKRANDPEFAHARSHFEEAAAEARSVGQFFQIQRRTYEPEHN